MVGVPPLTHDRALSLRTKSTLLVDTLNDCALLYTFGNKTEQYCIPRDERLCCMTPTEPRVAHEVLLVDDDDAVRAISRRDESDTRKQLRVKCRKTTSLEST